MAMTSNTFKTLLKSGSALVVVMGVAIGLKPTPVEAGGKGALIGFGVGVATGIIVNEAINNNRRRHPPRRVGPAPRRVGPAPRRRVTTTRRNQGVNRAEAMKIQTALNDLGYDAGVVDGIIGGGTRKAIRTFQIDIDDNPTGRLTNKQKIILYDRATVANAGDDDGQTFARTQDRDNQDDDRNNNKRKKNQPDNNQRDNTAQGDEDPDNERVTSNNNGSTYDWTEVQEALNALGYPAGPENGKMTKKTRAAIKAFQTDISREPTGVLTAEEQGILFEDAEDLASDDTGTEDDDDQVVGNDDDIQDDDDDGDDKVSLLGSDPSSQATDTGGGVTNNIVLTEYRAVSSISDPLQQLKAVRDARSNPPAFVADLTAAERLARESELSQLENDVKDELLNPIIERADNAPVTIEGVRQIAALEGSAEQVFAVVGQQESAPYRSSLQSRKLRILKALVSDQIGELQSYPQSLEGLQQSAAWYESFSNDYAGFTDNPVVVEAMETFESDRNERLTAMFPEFEKDVAGLNNPADGATGLLEDYLSWQGDDALPISLEYKFVVAQHQ